MSHAYSPDLELARKIVLAGLSGYEAEVFLYGSFGAGKGMKGSDIDVAVLPLEPIPNHVLSSLREQLEEASLLFPVELIDLSATGREFRDRVFREGVRWSGSQSG